MIYIACSVAWTFDIINLNGSCLSFSLTRSSYPTYTSVLLRAIEWWYHDPNVSTPVLKLMAELVQNRSQRLHFDVSSPNGILLFRVTSQMIVAYGMANSKTCCYERRVDIGDYRKRPLIIPSSPPPPPQLQAHLPENKKVHPITSPFPPLIIPLVIGPCSCKQKKNTSDCKPPSL